MKKKLKLKDLNVKSFVTSAKDVQGGNISQLCSPSVQQCPTIPLNNCPTYNVVDCYNSYVPNDCVQSIARCLTDHCPSNSICTGPPCYQD